MRRFATIVAALLAACASETVEVSTVDWLEVPGSGCSARADGPRGSCLTGPDTMQNTVVVQVLRHESPSDVARVGCTLCTEEECELVATECRCASPGPPLETVDALRGIVFGGLDTAYEHCMRAVSLYVPGNEPADGTTSCPTTFACDRVLVDADLFASVVEPGVRMCSLTDWAVFPGTVLFETHICRDDTRGESIEGCLGRSEARLCN